MVVEGGWASESAPGFTSSLALQAAYFRRQAELAERSGLLRWFQLTFTDLDLAGFPEAAAGRRVVREAGTGRC
jgi:hypothetical protein